MKNKNRVKCQIRNEKGQFVYTTGGGKYKRKQENGVNRQAHAVIWEEYYNKKLPVGWCVHHINQNKKDNRIDNLKAIPLSEHTRLHFDEYYKNHNVWNKSIKCPNISKSLMGHTVSNQTKHKTKVTKYRKYFTFNINILSLKNKGFTHKQISDKLNLTIGQVAGRWRSFRKTFNRGGE